jgi:WD40 repeat protein
MILHRKFIRTSSFHALLRRGNKYVLSGGIDGTVKPSDRHHYRMSACMQTFCSARFHIVRCLALFHVSSQLLSGILASALKLWDIKSGKCLRTYEGHSHSVSCVLAHGSIKPWKVAYWSMLTHT